MKLIIEMNHIRFLVLQTSWLTGILYGFCISCFNRIGNEQYSDLFE